MRRSCRPISNHLLLREVRPREMSPGGIYVPEGSRERTRVGDVVAVAARSTYRPPVGTRLIVDFTTAAILHGVEEPGEEYFVVEDRGVLAEVLDKGVEVV